MAHLNINGLLSKLDFIKIMLSESKFDIFAISESKLDASIHDNEIKIDGYTFFFFISMRENRLQPHLCLAFSQFQAQYMLSTCLYFH